MSDYEELRQMVKHADEEGMTVTLFPADEEGEIVCMTKRLFEEEKMDAKADGYQDGWQTGYDQGHEEGRDLGREDGLEEARRLLW